MDCTACGYDLRSLDASGACPECGQPIAVSEHDQSVARPRWLATIGGGSFLIGIGIFIGGAGVALAFPPAVPMLAGRVALWLLPLGVVVSAVGTWRFAAPTPRIAGSHGRFRATLLRIVGIVTCTLQLQLCLLVVAGMRGSLPVNAQTLAFCAQSLLVTWGIAAAMTCLRAGYVAAQVRDRSGLVQARALALLAPLTLLALALSTNTFAAGRWSKAELVGWSVAACVIAGWSAVLFGGFAWVVRRRARWGVANMRT